VPGHHRAMAQGQRDMGLAHAARVRDMMLTSPRY
jgi:hypothetical protein